MSLAALQKPTVVPFQKQSKITVIAKRIEWLQDKIKEYDKELNGLHKELFQSAQSALSGSLTSRQKDVLYLISLSNKEIADKLNISVRTVKFHVHVLLEKFGVQDRKSLMFKIEPWRNVL